MRILVVSDVHGNAAALQAVLREPHDVLVCLGDIVGYGPEPRACIELVRAEGAVATAGNHDRAASHGSPPRCRPEFERLAAAVAPITEAQLDTRNLDFLRTLPLRRPLELDGVRYFAVHATPSDPLYRYLGPDDPAWQTELPEVAADVTLVGHTHLPFDRLIGGKRVVNPGSVGQPKDGDPRAAYAVIDNGVITLKRAEYPVERTTAALKEQGLPGPVVAALTALLRTGRQ